MWLSEEEFREIYITEAATAISPSQFGQCLNAGIRTVTGFVGSAAALEVKNNDGPYSEKTMDLREAQGKLAFRELLLLMSSRFRDGGIASTERDVNDSVTNSYESFDKTERRRTALYEEALSILGIYRTSTATIVEDSFPVYSMSLKKRITW